MAGPNFLKGSILSLDVEVSATTKQVEFYFFTQNLFWKIKMKTEKTREFQLESMSVHRSWIVPRQL